LLGIQIKKHHLRNYGSLWYGLSEYFYFGKTHCIPKTHNIYFFDNIM